MGRNCCVLGCSSGVHLPFHTFPKDLNMANRWKNAIYSKKIEHLNDEQIRKCIVCYRHFIDSDYETTYRLRRLKPGVVPSINLPNNGNNNCESVSVKEIEIEIPHTSTSTLCKEIEILKDEEFPVETSQNINNSLNEDVPVAGPSSPKISSYCLLDKHMKYFHKFTPKMWKLYRITCVLKKKQEIIAKRQLSFRQRIRQAKQYSKSSAIEKLLSSLTPAQRTFIQTQIKTSKYAPKNRRFTLDEKIAALSIMKQSSKCYQYLTQVFNLPSIRTLWSILQRINIHPGPVNFINNRLKKQVKLMKEKDKVCLLMWGEMLLQSHLDYDIRNKYIIGFEDFGNKRKARFADHVLVFMIRGIQNGWKFPLTYYFCDGTAKTDQLIKWIVEVTKIVIDSGLYLVAFICNEGKSNRAAINKLKLRSARFKLKQGQQYCGEVTINNRDIIPLYDPPHLIKGIRNNLFNNDLEFDCAKEEVRKFASWQIIEQAYHMDLTHSIYRLMPKITMEHIIKSKIKKKKVKNATQVLSMTMGGFIHHHTKLEGRINTIYGPLEMPEKKGRDTAEIILFFDQLFDSVNGHTLKPEKLLRVAVSDNSPHFAFWKKAIKRLRNMRFVNQKDKNPITRSTILNDWISTIQGFRKLWIILKGYGFKYFKPRMLNQDPLEHFFGQIRSLGERNISPTCAEFESSVKTLLINNLTSRRTIGNNCENKVDGPLLFTLKPFINKTTCMNNEDSLEHYQISNLEIETKLPDATYDYLNICNCIVTKILNHSRIKGCHTCKQLLTNTTKTNLVSNEYILEMFKQADNILTQKISRVCYLHHTATMLETELYILMDLDYLNCQQHKSTLKELLISYMVVFYISKWCSGINNILTGEHELS